MHIPTEILALDFAALRTLKLVYAYRSFTAAASELGVNTSSVSYTIERVRKAARDPLFVKQGGGIAPTEHCEKLIKSVSLVLDEALNFRDDEGFDPLNAVGNISIINSSYETMLFLPQLIKRVRAAAPKVQLTFNYNYGAARELLLKGAADIYLGPQMISDSGIYGKEFLNQDQHLCMMDPSNPLAAKSELTLEDIKDEDHVHFEPRPGWQQAVFRYASGKGVELRKAVVSSDAISFGEIVVGSDLLAALPARMARKFQDRLALRPYTFETGMAEHMYWSAATDRSNLSRWVRSIIIDEAARIDRSPDPAGY
ncbi:MAG: LysR family transcriptional regulator [Paracoccaceae bacterium]